MNRKPTENPVSRKISRRHWLRTTATGAAVFGTPYIVPNSMFGKFAPSNRITVACIGTGNQGSAILKKFLDHDSAQVVGVCDVNRGSKGYGEFFCFA